MICFYYFFLIFYDVVFFFFLSFLELRVKLFQASQALEMVIFIWYERNHWLKRQFPAYVNQL